MEALLAVMWVAAALLCVAYLHAVSLLKRWRLMYLDEHEAYERVAREATRLAVHLDKVIVVANLNPETTVHDALCAAGFEVGDEDHASEVN